VDPELGNLVNLTILSIRENNISYLPSTLALISLDRIALVLVLGLTELGEVSK
jgi:hypothetical protein